MTDKQKIFLLYCIMQDLRCNFNWGPRPWRWFYTSVKRRRKKAMQLAEELNMYAQVGRLHCFRSGDDGRWLRAEFADGGYENMEKLHGFHVDRNKNYRVSLDDVDYPYNRFFIELSKWVIDPFYYVYDPITE